MWARRTFCDTLEEMRDQLKTLNFWNYKRVASHLAALIEENQTYGNRMEAGLSYKRSLSELHDEVKRLELKVKDLKASAGEKENDD